MVQCGMRNHDKIFRNIIGTWTMARDGRALAARHLQFGGVSIIARTSLLRPDSTASASKHKVSLHVRSAATAQ